MTTVHTHKPLGFTLIELMIVVAIIGVLSAIAVPAYQDYVKKSEGASALATMKSLLTPSELWYQEHGSYSAAHKEQILITLGINQHSNRLGTIDIPKDFNLQFTFTEGNAVPKGTTITYRRETFGWVCKVSDNAISSTSCPFDA